MLIHHLILLPRQQDLLTINQPNPAPSSTDHTRSSRVTCLRSQLTSSGFSPRSNELTIKHWRSGTNRQYPSAWTTFTSWCSSRSFNPFRTSLSQVAEFLTCEYDLGKSYSTIDTYRSALSSVLPPIDRKLIGQHPMVIRLLRGMYNERPSSPRYLGIWNVDTVLVYLKSLHPAPIAIIYAIGKDFPHKKEEMTKIIIITKLKAIRSKFWAAVDSGRKTGHGRVVRLYFESCEAIWGGSPATSTIHAVIESTDNTVEVESRSSSPDPTSPASSTSFESERLRDPENPEYEASQEMQSRESAVNERRNLLDAKLRGHKQEKLKRKLSTDSQLFTIVQEKMQMKRRLLDKMDSMDKEHSQHMARRSTSMEQLTGSIADGFAMLRKMMQSRALPVQYNT